MAPQPTQPRGEQVSKAGEVLLSHNHIALLHGLMDRPASVAASIEDWIAASLPYSRRLYRNATHWTIRRAIGTMHPTWIERQRVGHCTQVTLLPRGRAILDRAIPARIRGRGAYEGLRKLAGR